MRRPPPLWLIGTAFLVLPVLEIWAIIQVGSLIGAGWTLLLLVAGVVLGLWLIRRAGVSSVQTLAAGAVRGQVPAADLAQSAWTAVAGALLIVPGFITDLIAAMVVIPLVRRLAGRIFGRRAPRPQAWMPPDAPSQGSNDEPTVVRGDVV